MRGAVTPESDCKYQSRGVSDYSSTAVSQDMWSERYCGQCAMNNPIITPWLTCLWLQQHKEQNPSVHREVEEKIERYRERDRQRERDEKKRKRKKAFGQMSHSSLLPSTSGCVHVWHTRKTSPQATAQGLSGVCYGVGGIVLSRLRCNFQEEKQIQRMLLFPVIGSGAVMVEGFLFCFCFSSTRSLTSAAEHAERSALMLRGI